MSINVDSSIFLCFLDIFSLLFCVRVMEYEHQMMPYYPTKPRFFGPESIASCSLRFGVLMEVPSNTLLILENKYYGLGSSIQDVCS